MVCGWFYHSHAVASLPQSSGIGTLPLHAGGRSLEKLSVFQLAGFKLSSCARLDSRGRLSPHKQFFPNSSPSHTAILPHENINEKAPRLREGLFLGEGLGRGARWSLTGADYFGCCCWSELVAGAEELLESCSRSFFNRLISTRPPLMCLVLAFSSAPATGALPMPTR